MTVAPNPAPFAVEAVEAGGGAVVSLTDDPEALVWLDSHDVGGLAEALAAAPGVRWVQLPSAGVESMTEVIDQTRIWTCAKGAYAQPVAEHALTLALAGLRLLPTRIGARSWGAQGGTSLFGERVTILGGGGITRSLLELLAPFEVEATVVNRSGNPVPGAARTVPVSELDSTLSDALVVVLALSLTPETRGIIGAKQLGLMGQTAWLVNVARGGHVDTDALVEALREGDHCRRRARCDRPRAPARRPCALGSLQLHHHAPHRRHHRDGAAPPRRADPHQCGPLRRR